MPFLTTPTVEENLWTNDPLFRRYHLARGVTLLVLGSSVTATQYPAQEDLALFDRVYLGGRTYEITEAEATVLTNAGYGAYITP